MNASLRTSTARRWLVLASFMGVAGCSQALWLNFAPLLSEIQKRYQVSELEAGTLILCFPLLYVLLSMPAGAMVDRRGYRYTIALGSAGMALASLVRIYDASFWALLAGQIGIAIAQPYIINGITKLAADCFEEHAQALATGLGTAGMFIGMAFGMAATPALHAAFGLQVTMIVFAIITIACTVSFWFATSPSLGSPSTGAGAAPTVEKETARHEFVVLVRDPRLLLVFFISLLALGYFNGLTTWLELMLGENGIRPDEAGLVGGVMILGGILGSLVMPALSDRAKRRKPFLVFCGLAGLALTFPLAVSRDLIWLCATGALLGFLFLPGYALLLQMSEELAGRERAGGAAGVLMLAGNAGGVIVPLAMERVRQGFGSWIGAVYLLLGLLVVIVALAMFATETLPRRE